MSEAIREVVVVSGVRTAIGDFGGSLEELLTDRVGSDDRSGNAERAGGRWRRCGSRRFR